MKSGANLILRLAFLVVIVIVSVSFVSMILDLSNDLEEQKKELEKNTLEDTDYIETVMIAFLDPCSDTAKKVAVGKSWFSTWIVQVDGVQKTLYSFVEYGVMTLDDWMNLDRELDEMQEKTNIDSFNISELCTTTLIIAN
ncbi:MAG: hypothetical protein F4039_07345 [Gammaproteobacteria bacterium]|nr:hypothetical protein [Gammaproteobacteria bacterium]MYK43884.1 hypothetical protein [Gammaproteobacteria bacterium]